MRRYGMTGLGLLLAAVLSVLAAPGAWAAGSTGASGWGTNALGQLGDGTTTSSSDPTPIAGLSGVSSVAAGKDHGLALLSSGKVMAWGDNANGQLGDGSVVSSDVPVEVKGVTTATAIAAGDEFSVALLANGTVLAWGQNAEGQLGDGSITGSDVPVSVSGVSEATAVAAGLHHALALLKSGKVMAWGADGDGQLGNGTTTAGEIEPVQVSGVSTAKAIAAGGLSSYAVLSDGTVDAWGDNSKGQLGDESMTDSDVPVAVKGVVGATSVAAGENHALALVSGGTAYAWGNGTKGELGNGADTSTEEAVQVQLLSEATALAAGSDFSLAVLANGTVESWGGNGEGQLGDGSTTATDTPAAIANLAEVKGIAAGSAFALAYGPQLPTVTAVKPDYGPATGSTAVTITGTGFNEVKGVHFGSTSATSFTRESETTISATAPAGTGIVDVTVTVPGGTSPAVAADHFSYTPVVSGVSPGSGPQTGGTEVVISGTNLTGVSAVSFGASAAASFKAESATKVVAVSPAGVGTVDITLTGPGGTSETVTADHFTYSSSAPELGRCRKAASKKNKGAKGAWSDAGCTEPSSEGKFEWEAGPGVKHSFTLKAKGVTLQSAGGAAVKCKEVAGSGEYSGARSLKDFQMTLKSCAEGHAKCTTAGAGREGEVTSATLAGEFGVIEKGLAAAGDKIGVDLAAPGDGTMLDFKCGSTEHLWRGSVIAPVKANRMEKTMVLNLVGSKDHQKVERFEGESVDVPESSTGGAAYAAGALEMSLELRGRAEIEINSVH